MFNIASQSPFVQVTKEDNFIHIYYITDLTEAITAVALSTFNSKAPIFLARK
jgi:hypothetical protein